jgi:hypothetical protein
MTLKLLYKQPLRQTESFVTSVVKLLDADLEVPDHSTLSRRSEHINVPKVRPLNCVEDVVIIIDSTGLKVYGEKEWCHHKHGGKMLRRSWRKLHIGIDHSVFIHCSKLTTLHESDDSQLAPLLDGIIAAIDKIIGDGGNYANPIHDYCLENYPDNIPPNIYY